MKEMETCSVLESPSKEASEAPHAILPWCCFRVRPATRPVDWAPSTVNVLAPSHPTATKWDAK